MESQNKKMGRKLKIFISVICQSIFVIIMAIIFTRYSIFALEPNTTAKISITPTEAWLDFGKYFTLSMTVILSTFGVAKFILDSKLRIEIATKMTKMETNYNNLEESVKDLGCKINKLYDLHLKK